MERKKIMHVVEGFGGGVYSFLVDICNELSKEYDIVLIYTRRPQTPMEFEKDFDKNIRLIEMKMGRNINLFKDFINLIKLIKLIKKYKPNTIHLHSSKAGALGRVAGKILGYDNKKILYNPHGYAFLQRDISVSKQKIYLFIERIMAKIGGTIIAVSEGEYKETFNITKRAMRIDNAINEKNINLGLNKKNKNNEFVIGTLGRICYQKNPKLFNDIAKEFPNTKFMWIGDGELKSELTAKNIEITGWSDRAVAILRLNKIDIYLQTSLWEGLPIALLEAMYMGKVAIVSNVIGNNDVIIDSENGFICNSIYEFKNSISKLINNYDLYNSTSIKSKEYIEKNHLMGDMINKYRDLYRLK